MALQDSPVLCAYRFDVGGHPQVLSPLAALEALRSESSEDGSWSWIHVRRGHPRLDAWLSGTALAEDVRQSLTSTQEEATPCCEALPGRAMLLRVCGLRARAAASSLEALVRREERERAYHVPEDKYSLPLLVRPHMVLSSADGSLDCVRALGRQTENCIRAREAAFTSPGAFTAGLVEQLLYETMALVERLQEEVDLQEEFVGSQTVARKLRNSESQQKAQSDVICQLGAYRLAAMRLRRWFGPQRTMLGELTVKGMVWLFSEQDEATRALAARNLESAQILIEALENVREHSAVLKDELMSMNEARRAHALYIQAMVSALFLPFTFVTGLLSMYLTYPSFISGVSQHDYENQFGPNTTWTSTTSTDRAIPYHPPHGTSVAFYVITITCLVLLTASYGLLKTLRWL
jgi:Mg2+ and Co2+ transporter CorA